MLVIKRYPNRKLYDTEAKQYITLEGIAALIRQGREVQVTDYASGEDVTALILTQIILEQEKKQTGFLPSAVLTGLVQAGGNTIGALRRSLTSSLDLLHHVDEEIDRRLQELVSKGQLDEAEGLHLRDLLLAFGRRPDGESPRQEEIEAVLDKRGVPSRAELQALYQQLDALSAEIDRLRQPAGTDQANEHSQV